MTRRGAPIRFLVVVLGGWVAVRVALLWPATAVEALSAAPGPRLPAVARAEAAVAPPSLRAAAGGNRPPVVTATGSPARPRPPLIAPVPAFQPRGAEPADTLDRKAFVLVDDPVPPASPLIAAPASPHAQSRLSASAWGIVRGTGSLGAIATPQLGGSQAGVRFAYALGDARRFAATLRVASALRGPDREVAPGIEWRMPHVPVRLFAEHRIALGRNRGGPTAGAIAGISRALPARITLDGYAQGGVIARNGGEGFADGAIRVDHAVAHAGSVAITLGAGAWGAVQRDASRVDIGPTLAARVPVAGGGLRVAVDWRQRIAGNARPATGPALSIGADF